LADRTPAGRLLLFWSSAPNLWNRRAAIIGQNRLGPETDLALLHACIEPSIESPELLLQKAIGWALREVAQWNPAEVRRYMREKGERLSTVSRREALRKPDK